MGVSCGKQVAGGVTIRRTPNNLETHPLITVSALLVSGRETVRSSETIQPVMMDLDLIIPPF
jgi:hypothetical protein